MKRFWLGFGICYLIGAVSFGLAARRAMPFVTVVGDIYYGALWPLSPLSVGLGRDLYPIPKWMIDLHAGESK